MNQNEMLEYQKKYIKAVCTAVLKQNEDPHEIPPPLFVPPELRHRYAVGVDLADCGSDSILTAEVLRLPSMEHESKNAKLWFDEQYTKRPTSTESETPR